MWLPPPSPPPPPIIEVVTIRLHGWYVIVVFCCRRSPVQNMNVRIFWVRAMEWMRAQTVYSLIRKSFREWSHSHVNSKGKKPLHHRLRGRRNPPRCITQDSEPNTLPTELFRPQTDRLREVKPCTGGRNSSVGSAWARCPQRRGFDPPLGTFSVEGIFPLGVNMASNSIPPKTPSDESINRVLVCAYMHFIARTQKILTFMS